jgi:uncharacterized protein YjbI with pentapeptide repeats
LIQSVEEKGPIITLANADLRYGNLSNADLIGVDLRYGDLRDADLIGADLRGADMLAADLSDADLIGANLRSARNVTKDRLEQQAATLKDATMPDGSTHP